MMKKLEQKWINEGGIFFPISGEAVIYDSPGKGIFQVCQAPNLMDGRLGLKRISDKFEFNFKIYDLGSDDIIRTISTTWRSDIFVKGKKNLGVVFNGTKGTGKTLSAKLLCNELDIPVVILQENFDGLQEFMQSLSFECIVFIDEAEKTFQKGVNDTILLRLIDGVYNKSRKLYLLTTNELNLNNNLIGRPGRIRYNYEFGDLAVKAVNDYITDNLLPEYEAQRSNILQAVDMLEISTIDILKAIVDEVNIYGGLQTKYHMNLPLESYVVKILEFEEVKDRERIPEIKAMLEQYLKESGCNSLETWLNTARCDGGDKDETNEDMLDERFGRVRVTDIFSMEPTLQVGKNPTGAKITMAPDKDGFFMRTSYRSYDEYLCVVLRQAVAPSLYRGDLLI